VRILCLGGSTTYGSGLEAGETYPARLAALLEPLATAGPPPRRYEVINCGVPGYSTAESLIDLELRLFDFEPDALVIYHGINDARVVQARGFVPDYSHMRRAWREPELTSLEEWLWRNSYAYAWLARTGGFGPKSIRLEDLIYVEGYADLYEPACAAGADGSAEARDVNREGVAAFIRNIDSIVVLARARGVQVLLATFPLRGGPQAQVEGQNFAPTVAVMNRQLVDYARQKGVPLVDLAATLDTQRELFMDQVHLNAAGAAREAELVLEAARGAGLWGLSP
jgi:lysophospholipase L1-like esterase